MTVCTKIIIFKKITYLFIFFRKSIAWKIVGNLEAIDEPLWQSIGKSWVGWLNSVILVDWSPSTKPSQLTGYFGGRLEFLKLGSWSQSFWPVDPQAKPVDWLLWRLTGFFWAGWLNLVILAGWSRSAKPSQLTSYYGDWSDFLELGDWTWSCWPVNHSSLCIILVWSTGHLSWSIGLFWDLFWILGFWVLRFRI